MKILVFTEGTVTMQSTGIGISREERVKQSVDNVTSVNDFRSYIPNGHVDKLNIWKAQGAESIGGENEMTYPHIRPDLRRKIKSIVVKEFAGIDGLPDNLDDLERYDTN